MVNNKDRMKRKKSVAEIKNIVSEHLIIHGYMSILQKSRTLERKYLFYTDIHYRYRIFSSFFNVTPCSSC